MPITFNCSCGKALRVPDEHAGRRVKCPACQVIGKVPAPEPEPEFEIVEKLEEFPVSGKGRPVAKPVRPQDDDDDDDGRAYGVAGGGNDDEEKPRTKKKPDFRQGSGREDDDEDDDRPKKKKKRKKRRPSPERTDRGAMWNVNGSVAGGLFAMVGAVVWFVVGLSNGILFFYPPVLFVFGFAALVKGLAGEE